MEKFNREDVEALCKIPLSHRRVSDVMVWQHNRKGFIQSGPSTMWLERCLGSGLNVQQV